MMRPKKLPLLATKYKGKDILIHFASSAFSVVNKCDCV